MNRLKVSGVQNARILYFNFEDERLHLSVDELDSILQSFRSCTQNWRCQIATSSLMKYRRSKVGKIHLQNLLIN